MIKTYEVRRRCEIGYSWREGGEPCPEAHLWRLNEGLVRGGVLIETEMSESDFAEAVERYAADQADEIYAAVGVDVVRRQDTGDSPPRPSHHRGAPKKVLTRPPELLER